MEIQKTKNLTEEERAKLIKQFIKHNALHPGGTDTRTDYCKYRTKDLEDHPEKRHTWSFFKADIENLSIVNELLDTTIWNKKDPEDRFFRIQYNKRLLVSYDQAFALENGFKIDQGEIDDFDIYGDLHDYIIKISKENNNLEYVIQQIISYLGIKEMVEYIHHNTVHLLSNPDDFEKKNYIDNIRYLIYNNYRDDTDDFTIFNINSVYIDNDLRITFGTSMFQKGNNEFGSDAVRISFNILEESNKVNFLISDFDDIISVYNIPRKAGSIYRLLTQFFDQMYLSFTSIINYIDRKHDTKNIADKEYVYKEKKVNREELKNGAIKYIKYLHTRNINEYYPDERRSPRCHKRNGHWRNVWCGSIKNGTRHQELRWIEECLVNPDNDKMSYNDNSKRSNNG